VRGVEAAALEALSRRLNPTSRRPLAVALSGGGDSLALTLVADAWAREAGRELLVLTVDHGLNPDSVFWTETCRATAERLGRPFLALAWRGDKPKAGLPAAARAARHRLLAEAARQAGATVVLMGHTADDVAEAARMRAAGATTPDPREWAPSPAWPEGRGVFLLRPLLGARRAELRGWLRARGERWIEDPANDDLRFARSRARGEDFDAPERAETPPLRLAESVSEVAGILTVPRDAPRSASLPDVHRLVSLACVCAGGGARRPAGMRIARLAEALRGDGDVDATLAGARVIADEAEVMIGREPGEAGRGGLAPVRLAAAEPVVWDGRFELAASHDGLEARRLAGLAAQLPPAERARLAAVRAPFRGALPALVGPHAVSSPVLGETAGVTARSLMGERLRAAAGLVACEGA
jgi:tRNA(Ile)-lysidine synthase